MRQKLRRGRIPGDRDQRHLEACTTHVLHRRDAVRVIRDQRNKIHGSIAGKRGHIETDSHVNPLLLKRGFEVVILERCRWSERNPGLLEDEAAKFQDTRANGKQIFVRELMQPFI